MEKIEIKADEYEKFLSRLNKGEFGGMQFDPTALRNAMLGKSQEFFSSKFKALQFQRKSAKRDKRIVEAFFEIKGEKKK